MHGFSSKNITKCIHNNNHQPYSNMHVKELIEYGSVHLSTKSNRFQVVSKHVKMYRTNVWQLTRLEVFIHQGGPHVSKSVEECITFCKEIFYFFEEGLWKMSDMSGL